MTKLQEVYVVSSPEDSLSRSNMGLDYDAGTIVSSSYRVNSGSCDLKLGQAVTVKQF